jgi:macrolide transport system ATP-binding/permease protein
MRDRARFTLPSAAPAAVTQLSVRDVTKTYGTRTILDQVSFTVRPGEKAAVIGENGAGKSTLLRLLAAAETPDAGEITVSHPVATPPAPLRFTTALSAADGPAQGALAEFDGVRVGERLRLDGLVTIAPGQRLLVTGENGAGKTTLLRVLAGDLEPGAGTAHRPARTGYLPQELPAHSPRLPLLAAFAAGQPGQPDGYAEQLLALGLFREEDLCVPVAALSVGQRRRLQIARLVTRPADLLVLDEPTNHIALDLVEDLQAALAAYPGAVVAVSHDRGFRARFEGERLELRVGRRH